MTLKLLDIEKELRNSLREWRWHAASVIQDIPSGYLCTYGELAKETNRRTGLRISARNIAWLRSHLYHFTNRESTIPLHRIAKSGDTWCKWDSNRTSRDAKKLRTQEGSWQKPQWWAF